MVYRQWVLAPQLASQQEVKTVPVKRQSVPLTITANGSVDPERSINVSPKSSGTLKTLLVNVGDTVQEGQILAYMDDSSLQGQLAQAQGQLASSEANRQKIRAGNRPEDIASAQAQLDEAEAKLRQAELTMQQDQDLYDARAIALRDLESSRANRDSAQAQVKQAQQSLALQQAGSRSEDIAAAEADVVSAKGSLQNIQIQVDETVIRAPFSGTVIRKYADPGAFVAPTTAASSEFSATSSSILSLASKNQVVANVAETNIARMRIGQRAVIRADAYPDKTFAGSITEISPQSTVEQNVTSFEVKVSLSDPQNLLRSGMNVDVSFAVGQLNNVLLVPTVAIVRQDSSTGVYVETSDRQVIFKPIETGATVETQTEARSGLEAGENVLVSPPPSAKSTSGGLMPPRF
ncbi:MAG: efflux RND transporter periplasmic adaptor subunit [Drouetiella hepatica Uher 2000/2452]|uniref:Efflux RND transporter periplasmic adaptor subunit n=1 Tax=Drouetiella hepatica Uher 2000/2452 TaxID=904376 RepID=A0A951QEL5_9CYAN|nr:efflux RND transporter periplasmic adaptor subunit [Drouetiella hepatica Uher 2000/2452]